MASTPQNGPSSVGFLLAILQVVAGVLAGALPGGAAQSGALIAEGFLKIAQNAHAGYQAETGQPIDPTKLKSYDEIVQEAIGGGAGGQPA